MPIDIIKISKIKKKSQLIKYKIHKPLNNNDYLFHYMILTNNIVGLKLAKYPVNMKNSDEYNGFMLAAKYDNYIILDHFINTYPEYIYDKNNMNQTFLHFLVMNVNNNMNEFYKIIKKNNINWIKLFQTYSTEHLCPIDIIFNIGKFKIIKMIIDIIDINYSLYQSQPTFFNLFSNMMLKSKESSKESSKEILLLLETLYLKDNNIFTYVDDMGYNVSFPIIIYNDINIIHYMIDRCGVTLDEYSPITANHIFKIAYNMGVKTNDYNVALYLLNNIMMNHNFNETDSKGDNIIHYILKIRLAFNKGCNAIEKNLLTKYNDWMKYNISKISPFILIIQLDFKIYHKYITYQINDMTKIINKNITNKKITNKKIINKNNIQIQKNYKKWMNYIISLPKKRERKDIITMINVSYSHGNIFQAKFTDIAIFGQYLKNKYNNLFLPIYNGRDIIPKCKKNLKVPDDFLNDYNNFPWLIIWNNSSSYWIHPKLNEIIKNNINTYDYAFIILSLRLPNNGLHATLILYDFKRKIIERFDPYGNTTELDNDIDNILEKELSWRIGFKYISPSYYFPVSGFQTISDENNIMNAKLGDFGGYCLAWCFWYIEHRIINININPMILIRKTLNQFMKMELKPIEYIRNYANYLGKYRLKYYEKIGISEMIASNEHLPSSYQDILYNSIKNLIGT